MTTWQIIKRFFEPLKYHKINTGFSIGIFILWSIYYAVGVLFVRRITQTIEQKDIHQLYMLLGGFLVWFLVYQLINLLRVKVKYGYIHYFSRFTIHQIYLTKFFTLDHNAVEGVGTGKTLSLIQKGITTRCDLIISLTRKGTEVICAIIFSGYLISQISYWYLIAYIIVIIGFNILFGIFKSKAAFWRNLRTEKATEYVRQFVKIIMSRFEIIISGNTKKEISLLDTITEQESDFDHRKHLYEHLNYNLPEFLFVLFRLGMYGIIGIKVIQGQLNYAELVMIVAALGYLDKTVTQIGTIYGEIIKKFGEIEKMREFFDTNNIVLGLTNGGKFSFLSGIIQISGIKYSYNQSNPVFSNFSLAIPGGTRTALVGPSGGGKSTLVKLIAGYLHPQSGEIVVDGQALPTPDNVQTGNHISLQSYYPHIGYLTQEPSVFDGTIWENLTYGLQDKEEGQESGSILEQKIDTIISLARCEFIYEFKDGLQTEIGEKGIRLSGGQRQRLAIAKIMLKDPDIILLDEPTSALDSENEELVTQALNELFKGKTVIVIAHRLQTVKNADKILYIGKEKEEGRESYSQVLEQGTHEELLAMKGKYYKMVELQSGF